MLLHIIARGKIGRSPEAELVERYGKRVTWGFKVTELPDKGGTIPRLRPPPRGSSLWTSAGSS
jgi:23S rRNA (pseudouridine1915-N3)-methyltransferase